MIKRALLSVYDKTNIIEFAKKLHDMGVELISSGGTYRKISGAGIPVLAVEDVTKSPEMLDGRVKTLHPSIHGGILAKRDNKQHMSTIKQHNIKQIDMVVCNLYPFAETIAKPNVTLDLAIENIDIGGPSMLRSAAKNFADVIVIIDPNDYNNIAESLAKDAGLSFSDRKALAAKAFAHTAHYDSLITNYLGEVKFPQEINFAATKQAELRYGENSHQQAAVYTTNSQNASILNCKQHQGKALSYNNINDADAALRMVLEFNKPAAVAVKHTNPCGAAVADDILTAYKRAHDADPVSIYGGIVALNRKVEENLAKELTKLFLDIVIAPEFSEEALKVFKKKKNLRILEVQNMAKGADQAPEVRRILGGYLVQDGDYLKTEDEDWQVVTNSKPTDQHYQDFIFAWKLIKHVKSNSIVVVKNGQTLGVGCGQVNRIDAAKYAFKRAGENCKGAILASDGLFPFPDVVEESAKHEIAAIIQPGGSIRDKLSIEKANENNIPMIFTGIRHFKH